MSGTTVLLVATVLIALGFDFTNGFHDTANAVATSISTRALGPRAAVALSAVFNLIGALVAIEILHTHVANTIGGLVAPKQGVSLGMIIAALIGASHGGSDCRRAPHTRSSARSSAWASSRMESMR
jgi:inorganic phosphate transporter, PiT family